MKQGTRQFLITGLSLGVLAFSVSACTMGPDASRPDTPLSASTQPFLQTPEGQDGSQTADMTAWWTNFNDPLTNDLVKIALENNPDIKAASYRLIQSQANLRVANAGLFPTVDGRASAGRRRSYTEIVTGNPDSNQSTELTLPGASVSWTVDIWGKMRRAAESGEFDTMASVADRDATVHQIIAQTIRARITLAIGMESLRLAQENLESRKRTLEITRKRRELGTAQADDVRLAEENLAAAQAEIPSAQRTVALAQHSMDILLGYRPGTYKAENVRLALKPSFTVPPVGLPVDLLDRRPDLRASQLRQAARTSEIGVQLANLMPELTITAEGSFFGADITDLYRPERFIGSIVSNVAWKLFSAGSNQARVDLARAQANAAAYEYTSLTLTALREVEDALATERLLIEQSKFATLRLKRATEAEAIARNRFSLGQRSLLFVLETERRRRAAEIALLGVQRDIWLNRVDLHLSLGGDWGTPEELEGKTIQDDLSEYTRRVKFEEQVNFVPFPLTKRRDLEHEDSAKEVQP